MVRKEKMAFDKQRLEGGELATWLSGERHSTQENNQWKDLKWELFQGGRPREKQQSGQQRAPGGVG